MSDTPIVRPVVVTADETAPGRVATFGPVDSGPVAPPKRSLALQELAGRRKQLRDELYLDLKVPRWSDPEIFVRYNPIDSTQTDDIVENRKKSQKVVKEWTLLANCDILASSCQGVYACLDGDYDTKYSLRQGDPDGSWTGMDPDLAAALGLALTDAATVVRGLYATDGDILAAAGDLLRWSGISTADSDMLFSLG